MGTFIFWNTIFKTYISFFLSIKVVSVLHYSISSDSIKKGLWYSFRNWVFNKSQKLDDATVAVSNSVKKDYEEYFGWKNIEIILNAINLQQIDEAIHNVDIEKIRKKYRLFSNDYVIVLPGRLHESKGHRYLMQAIKDLKVQYQISPKVIIVGDGPLRSELKN